MNLMDAAPPAAVTPAGPLGRANLGRVRVGADLAAVQRAVYGKAWPALAFGADTLDVAFLDTDAPLMELECRLRCAGLEFELQLMDPMALLDLGATLTPGVPSFVQLAAVLHAADAVLVALEERLGSRIELVGLSGPGPAWPHHQALGLRLTREGAHAGRSVALLRALQPEGWQRLLQAAPGLAELPNTHDPVLPLRLMADAVPLTAGELMQLAPGDVLLLLQQSVARRPASLRSLEVALWLGEAALPGLRALRAGTRLQITKAVAPAQIPRPLPATPEPSSSRSLPMSAPEAGDTATLATAEATVPASTLDAIEVEVGLELGQLRLPLSTLRKLAVGQVHDVGESLDGERVVLWCGGQRLGLGQLVEVGDRLGVRIVALEPGAADGAAAAPRKSS